MRTFIFCLAALLLMVSCRSNKTSDAGDEQPDSSSVSTDTLPSDSAYAEPPKSADGLFDDFIYSFMRNPRFQLQRIQFPLELTDNGKVHQIDKKDWTFDHLYVKQDVYTLIFDSEESISAEKDTQLSHVVVEWVYLKTKRVKQYVFNKANGLWMLTKIEQHALKENVNSDFYEFYDRFSSDTRFQQKHISNPLHFKTYDEDEFQNIEGVLDAQQWPDFRPELPHGVITNINYGQHYGNAKQRVLMLCSQSGGMGCSLTFERKGSSWTLVKLVN